MQNLFRKYLDNQCSPEEVRQLLIHFNVAENESLLKNLISESLESDLLSADDADKQWGSVTRDIYNRINKQIDADTPGEVKVTPFFKNTWFRVAASVAVLISVSAYFFFRDQPQKETATVKNEKKFENDIAPGGDKAILTLSDGTKIILDSTKNGTIAQQGSASVIKTDDGQLTYTTTKAKPEEVLYNTVSTPRGGQYRLVLPDGSKVWLNAASSIYFPNVFTGDQRKVAITGEAYFEVAKNPSLPFSVEVRGMQVEVLGTHFNINSYDDEAAIKTTLLEGAVKVTLRQASTNQVQDRQGNKIQMLTLGQQAQLYRNGEIKLIRDADMDETMAWKNSKFIFNGNDIQSVMRQLEKWYDIEVEYSGNLTKEEFVGVISRNVNISQILTMLEKTRAVSFEIRDRKVIVK